MSKDKENSVGSALLLAVVLAGTLLFVPFMAAGLVVKSAVELAAELGAAGNPVGRLIHYAYGEFLKSDAIDVGMVALMFVAAPFVTRWAMLVVGFIGIYGGAGWLWHEFVPALTPWTNVDRYALPLAIGLLQAFIVLGLFPSAAALPWLLSRLTFAVAVAYCWVGPAIAVCLAWFYWLVAWLFS